MSVPWLRVGVGDTPADGGCILQVIDWVDRGQWTDTPPSVHPVLREFAVIANDHLDDRGRQRLLDLAPRLIGTASDDPVLAAELACFTADKALMSMWPPLEADWAVGAAEIAIDFSSCAEADGWAALSNEALHDFRYQIEIVAEYGRARTVHYAAEAAQAAGPTEAVRKLSVMAAAEIAAEAAETAGADWVFGLLIETLDEFDRLTGRTRGVRWICRRPHTRWRTPDNRPRAGTTSTAATA